MTDRKKFYYNIGEVTINGTPIHGLDRSKGKVEINTHFELEQCFCGCPWPLDNMQEEFEYMTKLPVWACGFQCCQPPITIEVHNDNCPNAKKDRLLRYVTEEENTRYAEIYRI